MSYWEKEPVVALGSSSAAAAAAEIDKDEQRSENGGWEV